MSHVNMFSALNESDSDDEAPKQQPKPAAPAPVAKPSKPERKPRNDRRDDRPRAERDDRAYEGGDKVQNPANDRREGGKGNRRDYGDRREGKGKGSRKGGESRGDSGREYPRRSGTGRGRENQRQGSGKYNWGKDTDGQNTSAEPAEQAEGAEPSADAPEAAPAPETAPEEEDVTIGFDEWEKQQAEKMSALNSLNTYNERVPDEVEEIEGKVEDVKVEDEYECMFHTRDWSKKDHGRKQARDGYKQADQVLNLKFVDENADAGKGKGGGKGDRRQGGKGERRQGGKGFANPQQNGAPAKSMDLMNETAFPSLA